MTYRQAQELGGQVRKGEGTIVTYNDTIRGVRLQRQEQKE
jgi:antirestriction protein ArdC